MLVEISKPDFEVELDIAYATCNNFTAAPIYKSSRCFLHADAALLLKKAIIMARELGYQFKIFDGFRPTEAQEKMWDFCPDPTFLAPPERGSAHSRGVAIDLSLIDNESGEELDMGTAFDAFTPLSFHGSIDISKEAQKNRFILLGIMSAAGFDFYKNEWWHYQLFDARKYELLSDAELGNIMM